MDLVFSSTNSFGGESSNSEEDQDDVELLYCGQACSVLSSLEETLGKIDDFLSFGRAFIHGDIVCSVKDPTGQMGKVIDVDIVVDLENMYGRKILDVNSKDLERIRPIAVGDYVVNGAWLGKVEKIIDRVTVLFPDGTTSDFTMSGSEKLIPTSVDLLEDSRYPFYPGQKVEVKGTYVPNSAGWFCGIRKNNKNRGTVCSVDAGLVYVCWLGCALISRENVSAPPALQDSRRLSLLSCFPHENWQLGDWCFFKSIDCMNVKGKEQTEKAPQKEKSRVPEIVTIVKIKAKVDVLWQDGSYSMGLDSGSLISISIIDPHDFWPGQIVLEKEMYCDSLSLGIHKWGVVKTVDAKERTVNVEWNTVSSDQPTNVQLQQTEERVSAYELTEHPDFSYCLGDAVFRLTESVLSNQYDKKACANPLTCKRDTSTGTDLCYTDDYLHSNLLSSIGVVIGLKDGDVEVKWASGFEEKVAPYEIYRFEKCEPITASAEQMNEERPQEDFLLLEQRGKDKTRSKVPYEEVQNIFGSSSCSIPQAAIGLLTRIGSSLFESLTTNLHGVYNHLSEDGEFQNEKVVEIHKMLSDAPRVEPTTNETEIVKEHGLQHGSMHHEHYFRQFDMVNDCSDHYFANGIGSILGSSQMNRTWLKKVQQEWTILERDLPETIYVRIYEERMDLLRAAIVGPQGTPYHDGLFFFDIILPPEYPNEPPMVYYNSGGLRVNPNLYESGKVCLSLLNTWTGSGSEVWNPKNSTILQVLLSLQALVLNEKPYFNEAGYDLQIGKTEGEKNSISYNENAFLVSCKSMLYLLRKPPKHFEALIEEHFSHRGEHILLACVAYTEGSPIGAAFADDKMDRESFNRSSTGFKIMLRKLFPRLVEAFTTKGIDCSHLSDLDSKDSP